MVGRAFAPIEGQRVRGENTRVTQIETVEGASGCDVLFLAGLEDGPQLDVLQELADTPTLTVGEASSFNTAGGRFVYQKNTLKFAINLDAAEHAGLKIAASLVNLATEVTWAGRGE